MPPRKPTSRARNSCARWKTVRAKFCDIQREAIATHEGVLVTPESLTRFFEDFTTDKFRIARRFELCYFFRKRFGPNWPDIVRQTCGIDARDFDREFIQFRDPLWAFFAVELYAYGLGFRSVVEDGLRRWQESVLKQLDAEPFDDPKFDHRRWLRASRSASTKHRNTVFRISPELVPIVAAIGHPFDPMMFAPAWFRTYYPGWTLPKALTRGRLRSPTRVKESDRVLSTSEWRVQIKALLDELLRLEQGRGAASAKPDPGSDNVSKSQQPPAD